MVIPQRTRAPVARDGGAKEGAASAKRKEVSYAQQTPSEKLRDLIARAGLTQRAAARELEVAERTMRYWCSGGQDVPKMALLALERLIEMRRTIT